MRSVLDLFSGCGGAALGFQKAGFRIKSAFDVAEEAAQNYETNLGIKPTLTPIGSRPAGALLRGAGIRKDDIDVIIGCPPCQGFTRMRNGTRAWDPRNRLVREYLDMVKTVKPSSVVFENVPGILSRGYKAWFNMLVRGLRRHGYKPTWGILQAADFGVPQWRRRVVVMANRDGRPELPMPSHGPQSLQEKDRRTVRDAIAGLPPLQSGHRSSVVPNHESRHHSEEVLRMIRAVPKNGGSRMDLPRSLWLPCHQKHEGHWDVYGRMRWDEPSPTITSGCTNPSRGRFLHPTQNRAITIREAARLQTFPDSYRFHGGRQDLELQIGNALPPLLATRIAEAL